MGILETLKQRIRSLYCGLSWADIKMDRKTLLVIIAIAFIFGIAIRFFITYKQLGNELYIFNGAPIIKSPDGYFFAEGARDILDSANASADGRSPTNRLVSQLTAALYYITPGVSFEWFIYALPPIIASLLVIPVIMMGIEAGSALVGFFAALVAVSASGFFYRTFAGYYDDDFLVLVLPFFFAAALVRHLRVQNFGSTVFAVVAATIYSIGYGNANTVMMFMIAVYGVYVLFYDRQNTKHYFLIAVLLLAISNLPPLQKIVSVLVSLFLLRGKSDELRPTLFSLVVTFGVFAFYGGLQGVLDRVSYYILKPQANTDTMQLHFFSTLKTVAESQYSDFSTVFKHFSGNGYLFTLGIIGFAALLYKDKRFLVLLPLLMTGLLAVDGGVRFTAYGSPILALGLLYLTVLALSFIPKDFIRYPILSFAAIGFMYPNYLELRNFDPPSVVLSHEAQTLNALSKKIKRDDYVYSWWDYGYQHRYYTKAKTLSDGGAQEGGTVYIESMALTMPSPTLAANLMRNATETREKMLKEKLPYTGSVLSDMMKYGDTKTKNPWELMSKIATPGYKTMKKTRDIYWVMPFRMLQIFSVIHNFADTDPITGRMSSKRMYFINGDSSADAKEVRFGNGAISVDMSNATVSSGKEKVLLGSYMVVRKLADGSTAIQNKVIDPKSKLVMIYMASYNAYLFMDRETFMSNFIQMFVLGQYDNTLFELVDDSQMMKVFKLKI